MRVLVLLHEHDVSTLQNVSVAEAGALLVDLHLGLVLQVHVVLRSARAARAAAACARGRGARDTTRVLRRRRRRRVREPAERGRVEAEGWRGTERLLLRVHLLIARRNLLLHLRRERSVRGVRLLVRESTGSKSVGSGGERAESAGPEISRAAEASGSATARHESRVESRGTTSASAVARRDVHALVLRSQRLLDGPPLGVILRRRVHVLGLAPLEKRRPRLVQLVVVLLAVHPFQRLLGVLLVLDALILIAEAVRAAHGLATGGAGHAGLQLRLLGLSRRGGGGAALRSASGVRFAVAHGELGEEEDGVDRVLLVLLGVLLSRGGHPVFHVVVSQEVHFPGV